ncbi:MAG TPA: SRPBCC family protein, partial [Steroidobacteraceae bacterium]
EELTSVGTPRSWMHIAGLSRSRSVAATLLAFVAASAVAPSGARADDTLETDVTREGRVLHVRATLGADAPATLCYAVLADFDRLDDFVPGLISSDVLSAPGEPIVLHQVGEASAGPFDYTLDVTLAVREHPTERIEFERVEGNLRQMKGSWTVAGDATHCDIAYLAEIEPAFWVPPLIGPVLMRNRVEKQLEGVLQEVRRRAPAAGSP